MSDRLKTVFQVALLLLGSAGAATLLTWAGSQEVACRDIVKPPPFIPPTEPLVSAASLYRVHCASCHGATGDGTPSVALDRPPRSFLDGGFSFGNTTEAISRVIAAGIPGSPMQAFGHVLSQQEIAVLAAHVQAMGPPGLDSATDDAEMIVGDRPVIVRGQLGPVEQERAAHPRGLVVGNPDGMSWVYRADDVRLLGVHQGRFLARDDWGGRGGTPLALLGEPVLTLGDWDPPAMFHDQHGSPLHAQLRSTSTAMSRGAVRYDLVADGSIIASVEETAAAHPRGALVGLRRTLMLEATAPLQLQVPGHGVRRVSDDVVVVHHRGGGEMPRTSIDLALGSGRITVTYYIVDDWGEAAQQEFWEATP